MTKEGHSKEYREGQVAAAQGLTVTANPYKIGSDKAMDWKQGWLVGMGYESCD